MKRLNCLVFQQELNSSPLIKSHRNFAVNSFFHVLGILVVAITFSTSAQAQQKPAMVQQAEADLIIVNEKIAQLDNKINAINARIVGIAPETLDPAIQLKLNDLHITRDQYVREKISIEAVLNDNQTDSQSDLELPISDSSFSRQELITEYPNRIE